MDGKGGGNELLQIFVRLLDGKTATIRFSSGHVYGDDIKQKISEITGIPPLSQRLISCGGTQLEDKSVISERDSTFHLLLRLVGGKGGFGSLLRGAATKAGQKKTNNFDACRDMSGRRLRHVNAEKRLEEWKAEEDERRLERLAEEFIKKEAKNKKKAAGVGDDEAAKYVKKYREDSAKCVVEVEEAVREACGNGLAEKKRKGKEKFAALEAKKLKIWMGKRKLGESDSEDGSDDDIEENGKFTVTNSEDHVTLTRGAEGSSDLVTGRKLDEPYSAGASFESGSKEEKQVAVEQNLKSIPSVEIVSGDFIGSAQPDMQEETFPQGAGVTGSEAAEVSRSETLKVDDSAPFRVDIQLQQFMSTGGGETAECNIFGSKSQANQETVSPNNTKEDLERPLNFDDINSAADLEVLGMERLKSELQNCGLKCGGTLQERAARLFLLKSTPLDKLPKKLLAKK